TAAIVRDAGEKRPLQRGQRDDGVRLDLLAARELQRAGVPGDRYDPGYEADAAELEQLSDRVTRRGAEQCERTVLGCHERYLDPSRRVVGQVLGRQQRELVQRQRPGDGRRYREREPSHGAGGGPLEQ